MDRLEVPAVVEHPGLPGPLVQGSESSVQPVSADPAVVEQPGLPGPLVQGSECSAECSIQVIKPAVPIASAIVKDFGHESDEAVKSLPVAVPVSRRDSLDLFH